MWTVITVQPELYKKELVRQESAESSSASEMEYAGKLHFALRYDKEIEGLIVKVSIAQYFMTVTNFNHIRQMLDNIYIVNYTIRNFF